MEKAYLILESGAVFEGVSFGAKGSVRGELVFTTGMTGCVESLTDPSYYGQIVLFTFPQMGNYGITFSDKESEHCHLRGVVVRNHCETPSNFRCDETLDAFLRREGVVGISGVDTRALTQLIRDAGVMGAVLTTEPPGKSSPEPELFRVTLGVESTSTPSVQVLLPEGTPRLSVALLDYGAKSSIARSLLARGCQVTVFPYNTPAQEVLAIRPDGVMLSNGPGDPQDNAFCITQIRTLLGQIPMFGICLGHQMMALSAGATTVKLKFGHHGANQPVKDLKTGKIYVTSQNHNYAVDLESLQGTRGEARCINVNDGTCEGVDYPDLQAFSLQYHPEAHGGPLDTQFAFDRFIAMMEGC